MCGTMHTEGENRRRLTVCAIVAVFAVLVIVKDVLICVFCPIPWISLAFVIADAAILIALTYFAVERIKEINEGLDNDINDY